MAWYGECSVQLRLRQQRYKLDASVTMYFVVVVVVVVVVAAGALWNDSAGTELRAWPRDFRCCWLVHELATAAVVAFVVDDDDAVPSISIGLDH
jgi:thiosulfate reductase cytochrome b subunit